MMRNSISWMYMSDKVTLVPSIYSLGMLNEILHEPEERKLN